MLATLTPAATRNLAVARRLPRVNAGLTAALVVTTLLGTGIDFTLVSGALVGAIPPAVAESKAPRGGGR